MYHTMYMYMYNVCIYIVPCIVYMYSNYYYSGRVHVSKYIQGKKPAVNNIINACSNSKLKMLVPTDMYIHARTCIYYM